MQPPEKPIASRKVYQIKLVVDDKTLEEIRVLAGRGLNQTQIWEYYGISKAQWYRAIKRNPNLERAISQGRSKMIAFVTGKLMELVKSGNLSAIMFYLKTRGGWAEYKEPIDITPLQPKPTLITINTSDPVEASRIYQKFIMEK